METTSHEDRAEVARAAYEALGARASESAVLQVQCPASHHVASVHGTDAGLVYHSVPNSRSHGRKDREDVGRKGSQKGQDWFDLLEAVDPVLSDELPAGCDCGPWTLSREQLLAELRGGAKKVLLD